MVQNDLPITIVYVSKNNFDMCRGVNDGDKGHTVLIITASRTNTRTVSLALDIRILNTHAFKFHDATKSVNVAATNAPVNHVHIL